MRRFKRCAGVAALMAGLATALVAVAEAATLKDTQRRLRVVVKTDANGGATRVTFSYTAKCREPGTRLRDKNFVEPEGHTTFRAGGRESTYTIRQRGGIRIRVTPRSRGRRVSDTRWVGTFSSKAVVRQRGRVIDRCNFRKRKWSTTASAG